MLKALPRAPLCAVREGRAPQRRPDAGCVVPRKTPGDPPPPWGLAGRVAPRGHAGAAVMAATACRESSVGGRGGVGEPSSPRGGRPNTCLSGFPASRCRTPCKSVSGSPPSRTTHAGEGPGQAQLRGAGPHASLGVQGSPLRLLSAASSEPESLASLPAASLFSFLPRVGACEHRFS